MVRPLLINNNNNNNKSLTYPIWTVAYWGGVWGVQTPPQIPKALQKIVPGSTVKLLKEIAEFRTPTPQDVREKTQ